MKGRLLTVKEINKLKDGYKVYIVPSEILGVCLDNEGLARVKMCERFMEFYPKNGANKTSWSYKKGDLTGVQNNKWLDIYEWIEEKQIQPKEIHKPTNQQRLNELKVEMEKLEKEIAEENINEYIGSCTVHKVEDICFQQHISKEKVKFKEHDIKDGDYTIEYIRNGNKVICTFSNGYTIGKGISKCHHDDKFNYGKGAIIAELRARSDFYNKVAANISK